MRSGESGASQLAAVADGIESLAMWLRRQAPTQVSSSTVTTLDTLRTFGPLRISVLAEREAISQPGMTTLVNRLEAAGLAERVADPSDGRATLVRITEVGSKILTDRHTARVQTLLDHLDGLDAADRAALVAALPAIQRLTGAPAEPASASVPTSAPAGNAPAPTARNRNQGSRTA